MASFRKLPSGKWQAIVKHPSGKRYTRTDPLKRTVVEWAAGVEQSVRRGEFVDPNAGKLTLDQWWEVWSASRVNEVATVSRRNSLWRTHVRPAFGSWPLRSIQSLDVETWLADMVRREVGPHAAASAFRLLRQVLTDAVRHRQLGSNPTEMVDVPKAPNHVDRFLSIEESDRLLAAVTRADLHAARATRKDRRPRTPDLEQRLFVRMMLEAGLRWQEVAGLHVFRVDLLRRVVRVQEVARRDHTLKAIPKTAAGSREVPLIPELAGALERQLGDRSPEGLLFPAADGGPLDYANWLKRVWQPAVTAAKLADPQPTPHDCRHSYGSWLANEGVPPHEIAALMGHSSLRSVERYIHASEARHERARRALGARRAHGGRSDDAEGPSSGLRDSV
jgi:integrase